MKATGIVRRIDDLGRVVIPKEIRRTLRIREGDPLEIITKREYYKSLEKRLYDNLSEFETKVLNLYKNSYSYAMIAEKLDTKVKSVDTAIQRIRKKAQKLKGEL